MDSESENEDDNGAGRPTSDLGRSKAGPEFIPFYERRSNSRGLRPPSELWLVSYSDFMTIMAIFFLVMYGYTYLKAAALLKKQNAQITYSAFADMISKIQQNAGQKMDIQNDTDKVVIQMKDDILFDSGKTELSSGAQSTLAELANSLKLAAGVV
jgi:flagellar motor protein MotB